VKIIIAQRGMICSLEKTYLTKEFFEIHNIIVY